MLKALKRAVRERFFPWYHWEHYVREGQRSGRWEVELDLLDLLTRRDAEAVDVGMNLGVYTTRLSHLCRRVHAFEPNPFYVENARPRLRPNVTIHPVALSDRTGSATLTIPRLHGEAEPAMATLEGERSVARYFDGDPALDCETMEVALRPLDSFGLRGLCFVKMDVEGHEIPALAGGRETLLRERPICLVEAQTASHPEAPENVFRFFGELGFAGYFLHGAQVHPVAAFERGVHQRLTRPGPDCALNFLFAPEPLADARLAEMGRRAARHREARRLAPPARSAGAGP